jgi:hypothetical protein
MQSDRERPVILNQSGPEIRVFLGQSVDFLGRYT